MTVTAMAMLTMTIHVLESFHCPMSNFVAFSRFLQTKVPNRGTTYWCKPFKVPEFPGKRQVMMVRPRFDA